MQWFGTQFILSTLLIGCSIHIDAAYSLSVPVGTRPPLNTLAEGFPRSFPKNAPPQPWDDHHCQSSLIPNMHLTFTFGEPLTMTRIALLLRSARSELKERIDAGTGNNPLRGRLILAWDLTRGTGMIVQPISFWFTPPEFQIKVFEIAQAVDLIERCGIAQGHIEEMWAYVYVHGRHVGYLWTWRYRLNGTSDG